VQDSYNAGTITELDQEVARIVQRLLGFLLRFLTNDGDARLERVRKTIVDSKLLFKVLLSLSDQQMVTGFAILTVGLVQIDSITEYHFAIVQNLSILSFVVYDTTAVILQDEVVQHRMTRHWRGVIIIGSMLITVMMELPEGHNYNMNDYGLPVKCIWSSMEGNYSPQSGSFWLMIFWMAILLFQLVLTLCVYFPNAFGKLVENTVVKATYSYLMDKLLAARDAHEVRAKNPKETVIDWCLAAVVWSAAVCIFGITEVLYSQAFGLQLNWIIMLNSINYIFVLRNKASVNGREGNEDEWGFSQAVPMFLLILPIATVAETAWGIFENGILVYDCN